MSTMKPVYLCAAKRTPIGSLAGSLSSLSAVELGISAVKGVLESADIPLESVDEAILGCILTSGLKQAPARQVALGAGLPYSVQAMTINKVCSSGLRAVMLAANSIQLDQASCIIAGGMESMSNAPYLLPALRQGARLGDTQALDSIIVDALWDVYNDYHMGNAAELCASEHSLSREQQDAFALESYRRATQSIESGHFKDEISPVEVKSRKSTSVVEVDEEPSKLKAEKVPSLRPAFAKDGTITAANASSINDGAAAMLVCSEEYVKEQNLNPLARVVSQGWMAQAPEWFTTAPIGAASLALERANKSVEDIDLFEINEAFSAVALACQGGLKVPTEKLNIQGGAVALGHPVGASGARILTTLLYSLKRTGGKLGLAAICNGGGEATALLVESV